MRVLGYIGLAILLVVVGFVAWWAWQTPTYVYRFRLGLEVEADGEVRRGAGVIEVRATNYKVGLPHTTGIREKVRGEAVALDLGQGKSIFMLLALGATGSDDMFYALPLRVFKSSTIEDLPHLRDIAELPSRLIPTLVTFVDLNDPATARVVRPEEFEAVFGAGVRFKQATIEMVSPGTWPLTLLGIGGEPVTRGIEGKLPWWGRPLPWVKPSGSGFVDARPIVAGQYRLQREHFKRSF
ncbi:MAG: hypothetical protein ABL908_04450 [Hyphomicrobium sp.]